MRSVADWYAAHGFVALCPDLFWRLERGVQLTDKGDDRKKAFDFYQRIDEAKAVEDSAAAMIFCGNIPRATVALARLVSVWAAISPTCCQCGSSLIARSATTASVSKSRLDEAKNLSSPLLLHIGGADKFCPPEAQAQIHAALDKNPLVTIHDYPDREHAFGRPGGEHYHAAAAELANLRSLEFLVPHLAGAGLASAQQTLSARWDDHVKYEFATRNTDDTLETMVPDAYVNHVPVMTGGVGHDELREFYSKHFIPQMPPTRA